ncbi:MAG: IgGFc-binding protein, partial [Bacteroidota bacterium]
MNIINKPLTIIKEYKIARIATILLIFLYSSSTSFAQGTNVNKSSSAYEGMHFFVGFMQNEIYRVDGGIVLQIYITSRYPGKVNLNYSGYLIQNYDVVPKQVLRIDVPEWMEVRTSEALMRRTVEIKANVPIVVYTFNSQQTTSDGYTAIPVSQWGKQFVTITQPNDQYKNYIDTPDGADPQDSMSRSGEFMIMAAYDSTLVNYKPTAFTWKGSPPNVIQSLMMNKGDCYLVKSYPSERGTGDISGTIINSSKPVGVISGHVRTAIPQNPYPNNDKNHLCEMLPPTDAWGKEFISVPYGTNDDGDWFKVAAIEPNTFVYYTNPWGTQMIALANSGDVASVYDVPYATKWSSNKPVQIGQFMMHKFNRPDLTRAFDPNFVILPPIENFVKYCLFQTCGNPPQNPLQFDQQH